MESTIGWYFVGFIADRRGVSIALIVWRLPLLKAEHRMESLVSREATFLFNNLLLVGIAFAVLWGVLFPLISEAIGDDRLNVTNPFFEFFAVAVRAAAGVPDGRGAADRLAARVDKQPGAHVHAGRR